MFYIKVIWNLLNRSGVKCIKSGSGRKLKKNRRKAFFLQIHSVLIRSLNQTHLILFQHRSQLQPQLHQQQNPHSGKATYRFCLSNSSLSGDALSSRTQKKPSTREEQINDNLNQMSGGLARLKNLGLSLQVFYSKKYCSVQYEFQNELDAQEDLIDDVDAAVQRTDIKTKKINKQMNNLLKDDSSPKDIPNPSWFFII